MLQLQECHASYGLNGKVVATITDNGSNFVIAFSVYSIPSSESSVPEVEDEDECVFEDMDELLQIDNGETEDLIYSIAV